MIEFFTLVLGAFLGWLASRHVLVGQAKLTRTLELMDEFNSEEMLLHRHKVWNGRHQLFLSGSFDEDLLRCQPEDLKKDSLIFDLIVLMWFFRKVALLDRLNRINRSDCVGLLGPHFEMYWTHVFLRGKGQGDPSTQVHSRLWQDLETSLCVNVSETFLASLISAADYWQPLAVPELRNFANEGATNWGAYQELQSDEAAIPSHLIASALQYVSGRGVTRVGARSDRRRPRAGA